MASFSDAAGDDYRVCKLNLPHKSPDYSINLHVNMFIWSMPFANIYRSSYKHCYWRRRL